MQAKHVKVLVRRDMAEIISTTVFEHEVDILRDIHGAGNIDVLEDEFPSVEIEAEEEYGRLANCYGRNEAGQPYVERALGNTSDSLLEFYGDVVAPKRGRKAGAEQKSKSKDGAETGGGE